jgi:hypothetical protein
MWLFHQHDKLPTGLTQHCKLAGRLQGLLLAVVAAMILTHTLLAFPVLARAACASWQDAAEWFRTCCIRMPAMLCCAVPITLAVDGWCVLPVFPLRVTGAHHLKLLQMLCCAVAQGPIWQSIKWLDELGMKIIEQVWQQLKCRAGLDAHLACVALHGVWTSG